MKNLFTAKKKNLFNHFINNKNFYKDIFSISLYYFIIIFSSYLIIIGPLTYLLSMNLFVGIIILNILLYYNQKRNLKEETSRDYIYGGIGGFFGSLQYAIKATVQPDSTKEASKLIFENIENLDNIGLKLVDFLDKKITLKNIDGTINITDCLAARPMVYSTHIFLKITKLFINTSEFFNIEQKERIIKEIEGHLLVLSSKLCESTSILVDAQCDSDKVGYYKTAELILIYRAYSDDLDEKVDTLQGGLPGYMDNLAVETFKLYIKYFLRSENISVIELELDKAIKDISKVDILESIKSDEIVTYNKELLKIFKPVYLDKFEIKRQKNSPYIDKNTETELNKSYFDSICGYIKKIYNSYFYGEPLKKTLEDVKSRCIIEVVEDLKEEVVVKASLSYDKVKLIGSTTVKEGLEKKNNFKIVSDDLLGFSTKKHLLEAKGINMQSSVGPSAIKKLIDEIEISGVAVRASAPAPASVAVPVAVPVPVPGPVPVGVMVQEVVQVIGENIGNL